MASADGREWIATTMSRGINRFHFFIFLNRIIFAFASLEFSLVQIINLKSVLPKWFIAFVRCNFSLAPNMILNWNASNIQCIHFENAQICESFSFLHCRFFYLRFLTKFAYTPKITHKFRILTFEIRTGVSKIVQQFTLECFCSNAFELCLLLTL